MENFLFGVASTLGAIGITAILILYCILHWEHIERFLYLIVRIFSGISGKAKLIAIGGAIQGDINVAISNLDKEVPYLFTKGVRIQWLEEGQDFANIDDDAIIVRVKAEQDHDRVYVNAVIQLLKRCLMIDARRFLHGHLMQAVELVLADRFFENVRFRTARGLYYSEFLDPVVKGNKSVSQAVEQINSINERGLFTRVFLRECQVLPLTYGEHYKPSGIKFEVNDFAKYLSDFVESLDDPKKPLVEFYFSRDNIKISFAVLADYVRFRDRGPYFYHSRAQRSIQNGAKTIYVLAQGRRNIMHAHELAKWLDSQRLVRSVIPMSFRQYSWSGEISSMCILCDVRPDVESREVLMENGAANINEADVHDALSAEVEAIRAGEVQVARIAILKDRIQVAINSTDGDRRRALSRCIGPNGVYAKKIEGRLKGYVRFVPWSSDLRQFILDNVEPFDQSQVVTVRIDPSQKTALIVVKSETVAFEATGYREIGLNVASIMTDYSVDIAVDLREKVRELMTHTIHSIGEGKIKIKNIEIVDGLQIKVQVTSLTERNPAAICGAYAKQLQTQLALKEWIWFCEFVDGNQKATLVSALFPLNAGSVIDVSFDQTANTATVFVSSESDRIVAIGPEGANVITASRLMGLKRIQVTTQQLQAAT